MLGYVSNLFVCFMGDWWYFMDTKKLSNLGIPGNMQNKFIYRQKNLQD